LLGRHKNGALTLSATLRYSPLYTRVKLSVGFCFFYYRSLTRARTGVNER